VSALNLTLQVWRQAGPSSPGRLVRYEARDISPDMSFLEMLDVVNERLQEKGEVPIAFDHDCREGICGSCSLMINGVAHGPNPGTATCQLHMRSFRDGDEIRIEPWRARAFPVVRDLVVDRSALDRIIAAGGYISAATGGARDANTILIAKDTVDTAMTYGSSEALLGTLGVAGLRVVTKLMPLPEGAAEEPARGRGQVGTPGHGRRPPTGSCRSGFPREERALPG